MGNSKNRLTVYTKITNGLRIVIWKTKKLLLENVREYFYDVGVEKIYLTHKKHSNKGSKFLHYKIYK